jgi:hypothetical protein
MNLLEAIFKLERSHLFLFPGPIWDELDELGVSEALRMATGLAPKCKHTLVLECRRCPRKFGEGCA